MNDYNIISLNILENCIHWIFRSKIHYKHKMRLINHIYRSYCIGDLFNMGLQRNYDWELINHSITFTTIVPLKSLYRYNIKMNKMIYNKYLSRSIIYTIIISYYHPIT